MDGQEEFQKAKRYIMTSTEFGRLGRIWVMRGRGTSELKVLD